jgi:hypothetical protein
MTATKIYKVQGWKNFQHLYAGCACGNPDCAHNIWLEVQDDTGQIIVCIESKLAHCNYQAEFGRNIFKRIVWRIKSAITVLFTGKLTASSTFIFDNAEQIKDYTTAINNTYDIMKEEAEFKRILNGIANRTSAID